MEAEEALQLAALIPGKKGKHKPLKKGKYNVQEDKSEQKPKKVPAKKGRTKEISQEEKYKRKDCRSTTSR